MGYVQTGHGLVWVDEEEYSDSRGVYRIVYQDGRRIILGEGDFEKKLRGDRDFFDDRKLKE